MLYPIIPGSSIKALKIFGLVEKDIIFASIEKHDYLKTGSKINKIEILFKKIDKTND